MSAAAPANASLQALQAVHLRGKVHVTARELRAALVFILFGLHSCKEYHETLNERPLAYWDLAFDAGAPGRQGEVLRELARFRSSTRSPSTD